MRAGYGTHPRSRPHPPLQMNGHRGCGSYRFGKICIELHQARYYNSLRAQSSYHAPPPHHLSSPLRTCHVDTCQAVRAVQRVPMLPPLPPPPPTPPPTPTHATCRWDYPPYVYLRLRPRLLQSFLPPASLASVRAVVCRAAPPVCPSSFSCCPSLPRCSRVFSLSRRCRLCSCPVGAVVAAVAVAVAARPYLVPYPRRRRWHRRRCSHLPPSPSLISSLTLLFCCCFQYRLFCGCLFAAAASLRASLSLSSALSARVKHQSS